jgi:nucleoside-diphosphate-sugar epimerase
LKRILVTGGSGFLGAATVRHLLARRNVVRVFDLRDAHDRPSDVEFVAGDVRDPVAVARAMRDVDVVHHQIAQVPLAKDKYLLHSVNVVGTENVLAAAAAAHVQKVVVVSSSAVYGMPDRVPIDARTPTKPAELYGQAKLAAEMRALAWLARGLDVSIVRPRTILGAGRLGIFQLLFEWVRRGRPIYTLGAGDNRYQFVHVDDLADLCLRAERPGHGVWLGGATVFGTMRELLLHLVQHARTRSPVRALPLRPTQIAMALTSRLGLSPLASYHALAYGREIWFDTAPTRAALDWQPQHSNDAMLAESFDWYVHNRARVLAQLDASPHRSALAPRMLRLLDWLP